MPIYEYRCPECGNEFEKMMKMSAAPPPCPECGHEEVVKKVSASAFVLKGSGWYKDHYGLKKSPSSPKTSSDGGSESSPSPSTTSSTATATATPKASSE
ncbi:MAG: zinc ribbon domain-containing protein [Deltaproteobacteria bacterium]|nr:MAG: zinc ribbon domain-containing protein [Deltaproteobacteria bacterium]